MPCYFSLSLLLLLLAKAECALGDSQKTTTIKDRLTEENNQRIFNTILQRSKRYKTPTSNHLGHFHGESSIENSTHIRRGNRTCLKIHCVINHYVRSCDVDGGNDTCEPCAEGTFFPGNTSSELHNHQCVTYPECFPDAVISSIPYSCAGHHVMNCKCDVTRNFCGLDPCSCSKGQCRYSAPVLRLNCDCDRLPTTTIPTTTATTTTTKTTIATTTEMSPVKTTERGKVSSTPEQTTNEQTQPITPVQTTAKSDSTEDAGLSGGEIAAIIIGVFIAVVVVAVVILYKKRKNQDCCSRCSTKSKGKASRDTGESETFVATGGEESTIV